MCFKPRPSRPSAERRLAGSCNTRNVVDRNDPVLRLLPHDDDLPRTFLHLQPEEQAWRGRFFAVAWLLTGHEAYAWALALAPDPTGANRATILGASDQQILDDLTLYPLTSCRCDG
jgi:hypothetical protein